MDAVRSRVAPVITRIFSHDLLVLSLSDFVHAQPVVLSDLHLMLTFIVSETFLTWWRSHQERPLGNQHHLHLRLGAGREAFDDAEHCGVRPSGVVAISRSTHRSGGALSYFDGREALSRIRRNSLLTGEIFG